ncbi:hypothetical protein TWF694_002798 [Orbilia ellipsospora]|uniref:HAUS augmin-like complex subunit 6 N-terminal domain-containing protein n=1 Tax=Orbilia ellipsospora TaxID=2528407 RepID=A0AAV9X002_9PEZI
MRTQSDTTPVTLLLTNLRLLDLPVLSDLAINEETFSLGKNKSKAFEHIAHHIFDRYDPVESKSRFAGSWPIYEPAQSKIFRAAAINWLNDLKKTGALHNTAIIRKSMFDECHGERYEELLLSLSTMALKKVVERDHNEALKNSKAFEEALTAQPDLETTTVLNLAYQTSLKNILQRRFVDKKKWFLASRRLEERDQSVSDREQATELARESRVKLNTKEKDITSIWEKNWVGDQSVYRLLLPDRDSSSEQELWSNAAFQQLLKTGSFGKPSSTNDTSTVLGDLETALKVHENRLLRWAEYSDRFLRERSGSKKLSSVKKVSFAADVGGGFGIGFNKHQNLHASAFSLQEGAQLPIPSTEDEYGKLFNSMRKELQTIRVSRRKLGTLSYTTTYGDNGSEDEGPTPPQQEPKQERPVKDMTEEEALSLLTAHLPVDVNYPNILQKAVPPSLPTIAPTVAEEPPPKIITTAPPELEVKPSPKPRLRSPPPPPKSIEPSEDPEDSPGDATASDPQSPESPRSIESPGDTNFPKRGRQRKSYEEEDSVDDYMVEKMLAHISTSVDTPAPVRPQRTLPNPTWSREELEEDPFKPRPKVALSPQLTPFQSQREDHPRTPVADFHSVHYSEDDDEEDDEAEGNISPSKGRGSRYK